MRPNPGRSWRLPALPRSGTLAPPFLTSPPHHGDEGVLWVRDVLEHAMTGEGGQPPAASPELRAACAALEGVLPRPVYDVDGRHDAARVAEMIAAASA